MLESLRAYGYSLNSAVADLIDNSITANAKNVWITLRWKGECSWISIRDDGDGMTEEQLSRAMIAGSQSPRDRRERHDLGRFGLGLKTASLSLARVLTVVSKKEKKSLAIRRWDLDYIAEENTDQWRLLKSEREGSGEKLTNFASQRSGTVVLLENLDNLCAGTVEKSPAHRDEFYHKVDSLNDHLGMIFHRFLTPPARLKIFINGESEAQLVKPWDPFFVKHKATDPKPEIKIPFGDTVTNVQGFILPHKDMLTSDEYEEAGGPLGWNSHQGFYIYRGDRLLVSGSWLGLREGSSKWRAEEHYKLARIRVDITNEMDKDWKIDVKKSLATPPHNVALSLVRYASKVRAEARDVFAHRGKYGKRKSNEKIGKVWMTRQTRGQNTYRLDRNHPVIKSFLERLGGRKNEAEAIFRLIEETVPVEQIWLDSAESPEMRSSPFGAASEDEVIEAATAYLNLLQGGTSVPTDELISEICDLECFSDHKEIIYAHFGAR
ncbi:ATP-binding protein [Halomonas mongoliensis]|uniref:ATP-binding protein n=1 Tax=Halomonas mongoliensis TaxID=321265 RepID=UPI00403B102D